MIFYERCNYEEICIGFYRSMFILLIAQPTQRGNPHGRLQSPFNSAALHFPTNMRVVIVVLVMFFAWGTLGFAYEFVVYDDKTNNCKHQSIALHDWLAEQGIESHYEAARISPTVGHVWVVVDVCGVGVPIESTSLGVINPLKIRRYMASDWTFATTEEMLAFR